MSDLKGKVAVVTGAASGIGKQIALTLANSGAAIAIVDLNEDGAKAVAKEITDAGGKAIGLRMDVTDEQAVDSGIDRVAEKVIGLPAERASFPDGIEGELAHPGNATVLGLLHYGLKDNGKESESAEADGIIRKLAHLVGIN